MPRIKFTDFTIKNLKLPEGKREKTLTDETLPAFGHRIRDTGARAWTYTYRYRSKQVKMTLGTYPRIGLKDARALARAVAAEVAAGGNPAGERK
jgi:hypothetical protein